MISVIAAIKEDSTVATYPPAGDPASDGGVRRQLGERGVTIIESAQL
jgi:hypothetical protein